MRENNGLRYEPRTSRIRTRIATHWTATFSPQLNKIVVTVIPLFIIIANLLLPDSLNVNKITKKLLVESVKENCDAK
jgi:hypothetical protein